MAQAERAVREALERLSHVVIQETEGHLFGEPGYDLTLDHLHDEAVSAREALTAVQVPESAGRPLLLDLFCGAGGAAKGYQRAGFHVVGVDIAAQPNYCGDQFIQADAMEVLAGLDPTCIGWDAIHASPVCHDWSPLANVTGSNGTGELLLRTLEILPSIGLPWVVENTTGAPLPRQSDLFGRHGVELCGTMFGLKVIRHRLFEASFPLEAPPHGSHIGEFYAPAGHGASNRQAREANPHLRGEGYADRCREAMGIDWMTRDELAQAIPPAYTEFIGGRLLEQVEVAA